MMESYVIILLAIPLALGVLVNIYMLLERRRAKKMLGTRTYVNAKMKNDERGDISALETEESRNSYKCIPLNATSASISSRIYEYEV